MTLYAYPPIQSGALVATSPTDEQGNVSPSITGASSHSVAENTVFEADYSIPYLDGVEPTLSGADASKFKLTNPRTDVWRLSMVARDYEAPVDANKDNFYEVVITADDGVNAADSLAVTVSIIDVDETVTTINYLTDARKHVTQQFENKSVFDRVLELLFNQSSTIQDVFKDLLNLRSINRARGAQLDIIGRIVGQPRETLIASLIDYFGFSPELTANAFGTLANPGAGGRFRGLNESSTSKRTLTDEEYRFFIKAKIIKNVGRATAEDVITSLKFILEDVNYVSIVDGPAEFTIHLDRELTTTESLLITDSNIVPKPIGVTLVLGAVIGDLGYGENYGQVFGS